MTYEPLYAQSIWGLVKHKNILFVYLYPDLRPRKKNNKKEKKRLRSPQNCLYLPHHDRNNH